MGAEDGFYQCVVDALKRLRKGESNNPDLGGVLQTNNIHMATCKYGEVTRTLAALKASPATDRAKARFVLAMDGDLFEAEDLTTDDAPLSSTYADFPNHFGFSLPLAGITTVKQVRESSFNIRATSCMNRIYVELLKDNPNWGIEARRHDMNHFLARLIFCFFAERTDIFHGVGLFTDTIAKMSAKEYSDTHEVIDELFRAMNIKRDDRERRHHPMGRRLSLCEWRTVLRQRGHAAIQQDRTGLSSLYRQFDWTKINSDIFGSIIQAVAEDEERGALEMHDTSVPNILKVLNPLFLDGLHARQRSPLRIRNQAVEKSAAPWVGERTIELPFRVGGAFAGQNGPSSAAAVSVAPSWPLSRRHTSVDRPTASLNSTPSLWL